MKAKTQLVFHPSSKFTPEEEYILVKPDELKTEKQTESGIVYNVNQSVVDRPTVGTVIQEGNSSYSKGDTVLWPNTDGIDLEFEDGTFTLLRKKSILGSVV